jgi:formylglycine-generating enzyme required for sulfatase activity
VSPINSHRRLATWVHDIGQVRTRDGHARVVAFNNRALAMRSSARRSFVSETRIDSLGFRVVRQN